MVAMAVQFAYQSGFTHRDIKPGNPLFAADATRTTWRKTC
jgi:hypothetical protein